MGIDKEPQVWMFEIVYEFAVIAANPEFVRQDLLDLEGEDYEEFKKRIRYKRMQSVGSIPLIPHGLLHKRRDGDE